MTLPRPLRPIFTFRRTAFAVFVALSTLIVTGGVIGFAAADDAPHANVPAEFRVDRPRVGDFANYSTVSLRRAGDAWTAGAERPYMSFEWLPSTTIRDASGNPRLVHPLRSTDWRLVDDLRGPVQWTYNYEVGSEFLVATGFGISSDQTWDQSIAGLAPLSANVNMTTAFMMHLPEEAQLPRGLLPFCGIYNEFQVGERSTRGVEIFESCPLEFKSRDGAGTHAVFRPLGGAFDAVARDQIGAWDAVVFQRTFHGTTTQVWFNDTIPYPLQFAFTDGSGEDVVLVRLHQFDRGGAALLTSGRADDLRVSPDLEWADREKWGPSDAGVDHPFPLSAAFRHVTADPSAPLQEFRSRNPDAVVVAANYIEDVSGDRTDRWWQLQFADRDEDTVVGIIQRTERSPLPIAVVPETSYIYKNGSHYNAAGSEILPPHLLPSKLPTVASMMRVWQDYASAPSSPNAWGFTMQCGDEECSTARIEVTAGSTMASSDPDATYPIAGDQSYVGRFDAIMWQFDENLNEADLLWTMHGESNLVYNRLRTGAPAIATPAHAATVPAPPTREWVFPTSEYAIGAGAFAVLVGLVYWLWPALRHVVGFGLFTRLEKPAFLEHPMRQQIVSLVEANPGIHFAEIVRRVGGGNGNVDQHLRHLVGQNLLTQIQARGYTCYVVPGSMDASAARALPALKSAGARAILAAISEHPGTNSKDVARAVGMREPTVHYHLGRLREAGLVSSTKTGKGLELHASNQAAAILAATA